MIVRLIAIVAAELAPHVLQMLTGSKNCHMSSNGLKTCMVRDQLCIDMQHDYAARLHRLCMGWTQSRRNLLQAMQSRGKNSQARVIPSWLWSCEMSSMSTTSCSPVLSQRQLCSEDAVLLRNMDSQVWSELS